MLEAPTEAAFLLTVSIASITTRHDGTLLRGHSPIGEVAITVPSKPDLRRAERWAASIRRVDLIEFHLDHDRIGCTARGQGTRLPFARSVPLAIGLGLGLLGAPVIVSGVEPD